MLSTPDTTIKTSVTMKLWVQQWSKHIHAEMLEDDKKEWRGFVAGFERTGCYHSVYDTTEVGVRMKMLALLQETAQELMDAGVCIKKNLKNYPCAPKKKNPSPPDD